jgi:hypothetical protein
MKLEELAMVLGVQVEIRYPDIAGNYMCDLDDAEVKEPGCLVCACGRGKTPDAARADYVREIRGKRLVVRAFSERRHECMVPVDLE